MFSAKKSPAADATARGLYKTNLQTHYSPSERLLPRLDQLRSTGTGKWLARCPAHPDKNPSLSIRECTDGTLLIKCWSGCTASEITDAAGLSLSDLFPPKQFLENPKTYNSISRQKRREYIALLKEESYLIAFALGVIKSGGEFSPDDAERVLLADSRVKKLRGLLNV